MKKYRVDFHDGSHDYRYASDSKDLHEGLDKEYGHDKISRLTLEDNNVAEVPNLYWCYSKVSRPSFDDEAGYLTKETLDHARRALGRQMEENIREQAMDTLGLHKYGVTVKIPKEQLEHDDGGMLRFRIGHKFEAPKMIQPGTLVYVDDDFEEFDPWAEVAMFFGGKAYGRN